jgi:O-acetyl-ADP-ribose deacetylase (regulator of RNase III)
MITPAEGNLLDADVDALVNTVNTVGVMGKGLALQFKRAFPAMYNDYAAAAKRGDMQLGRMHVWPVEQLHGPRFIINFPTKSHWRASSKLGDIERGLDDLVDVIRDLGINSVAVPPLGCGNGGLDWAVVEPIIRAKLAEIPEVDVRLFAPSGAPAAADMRTAEPAPPMTRARAAVIETVAQYSSFAVGGTTLIELQKLMYFLQRAGEPLKLDFNRGYYGPYADNLRHALKGIEGHYLSGYGDGSQRVMTAEPITLMPNARESAAVELAQHPEMGDHITRVLALTEGYESPYSLELLATVDWIIGERPDLAELPTEIADIVGEWSPRKGGLFSSAHVEQAWRRLRDEGWLPAHVPA